MALSPDLGVPGSWPEWHWPAQWPQDRGQGRTEDRGLRTEGLGQWQWCLSRACTRLGPGRERGQNGSATRSTEAPPISSTQGKHPPIHPLQHQGDILFCNWNHIFLKQYQLLSQIFCSYSLGTSTLGRQSSFRDEGVSRVGRTTTRARDSSVDYSSRPRYFKLDVFRQRLD